MHKRITLSTIAAVAALAFASPVLAQDRSTVSGAELDAAVVTGTTQGGAEVRHFLSTEQVQKAAAEMGVSASELSARVAALDEATIARLAQQSGLADQALAGGGSERVVLSTTGIIIILLILILLVR